MTLWKWSTTAATNDDVDSTINWQEGQSPGSINGSARAMMAATAKYRDDMSGNLVTAGTSTAYTLTTNQTLTALTDGFAVTARMDETSGATPTLNVDSLGAKSIAGVYGTAIATGALLGGGIYTFVYDSTDDKWIVHGKQQEFASTTAMLFVQTSAPTGWTKSATHNDKTLRVVTGAASSGGSTAFSSVFAARTITQGNLPNVSLSGTAASDGAHTHSYEIVRGSGSNPAATYSRGSDVGGYGAQGYTTGSGGAHTHTVSVSLGGSGTAMDFAVQYVDVIICSKD